MEKSLNVVITGANGFIGKNLVAELNKNENLIIKKVVRDTSKDTLKDYLSKADIVFHLAGVNRPKNDSEFIEGNRNFTNEIIEIIKEQDYKPAIVLSSSIQAVSDNAYGLSKKAGEQVLLNFSEEFKSKVFIYRLPNVFGKWCKPNYNSVVATFCHNISHNIDIHINDENHMLNLVYIDDVIKEFKSLLDDFEDLKSGFKEVGPVYEITLGKLASKLESFKLSRENRMVPDLSKGLFKKLYSTYLSYLDIDEFAYNLKMNVDNRGSFTEFLKTEENGQVSINISKPGIVKGNHWHHTKNEKFLVVSGEGVIRFRKYGTDEVIKYHVSGDKLEVVDIPTGYTHNIENLGHSDMVTVMWANELFDPNNPDTYFEEV
ncbi:NAD dependent epimerase/dehydratase family protein [Jeotgalicoccus aerolatus]|uniref:UDP-2-acetamido-2,6-beta-L-arabino-hexul-4-ose reductase n=1 Tax=Jeotgalicoccus aerolatus TaxID=709510 RepID=A0ABS4HLW1_9STAP|nr:NAD-dependent epimerase/dehydratase family protein [Jeotgalicoccus aerolatus]MBP1951903.1 UDP-2-acetamido-2,6-beta-L-arabino-hexul-4-ose reductase [Jeotgalicoccus aerolatus]GGD93843.1 capsular polysaccharide biosynthesis protein Cap8F [Jeotgalicoccus aerolatus]CAD2074889.1 NAD dependent epimerase/dehydratase family protein [Jeotgalicoccus aerolatus]